MSMTDHLWPSREEWAKERRTPYWDRTEGIEVRDRASAYLDAATVEAMIAEIKKRWLILGKQLRATQDAQQRIVLKDERHSLNSARWALERGAVPELLGCGYQAQAGEVLTPLLEAQRAAHKAAFDQRVGEIEATPIAPDIGRTLSGGVRARDPTVVAS